MEYISKNPFNGEKLAEFETISGGNIQAKILKSAETFSQWRRMSFARRGELFMKLAQLMEEQKTQLAETITLEMGKPVKESAAELDKSIFCCKYYAHNAEPLLQSRILEGNELSSEIVFQPLGVIFGIFPWNYPFWQVLRFAVPSLMAGNTAVFKHAANVPQCAVHIERLFRETGFPEGVLTNLFITHEDTETVISHPDVKAVTLTGSERAGSSVAALAGKYLKKSVMELGGSDAFVVLEDCDFEPTLKAAVRSRFQNSGQSCNAAKRFIVRKEVAEQFTAKMQEEVSGLSFGNPIDQDISMGTLARNDLANTVLEQINKTVEQGAKLVAGGRKLADAVVAPTILTHVPANSPAASEEVFGPVAPIFVVETDEEALKLANATKYGLSASVWTKDENRARYFAEGLNCGMVYINETVRSTPELPFGGIGFSGYGRELSEFGITEFVNIKSIVTGNH